MDNLTIGEQIKNLRKEKKLTQKQLAEIFELDQSSISYYEQNKKLPDIKMLNRMASFFDVTLDVLVRARNLTAHDFTQEQGRVVREVTENYLTPDDLKKKFQLIVDGRPATDEEIEEAMRYIAIQRRMKEEN